MDATALAHLQPPSFLKLLAHELRWRIVMALTHSDRRGLELVGLLGEPQNLVSYHLKRLREEQLVTERRSSADARDIYYSVNLDHLRVLYRATGDALHPALNQSGSQDLKGGEGGAGDDLPPTRVLFLCTHNSARSQMAEAIARHQGGNMVEVHSAGTEPSRVHPTALRVLHDMKIDASGARSKHVSEFEGQRFDYIITVCDRVKEACPYFPGDPEQKHWSFLDPAAVEGDEEQLHAFLRTAHELTTRIHFLLLIIEKERKGATT